MAHSADVVVVGGGIVGTATAASLAQAGRRTILLESRSLASGTSSATFAWLNATSKASDEAYHRLNASGMEHYRKLARTHGERVGLHASAMIEWVTGNDPSQTQHLRERLQNLKDWGYDVDPLNAMELQSREPNLAFPKEAWGIRAGGDGWLDAKKATHFFADSLREQGGEVWEHTPAVSLQTRSGKVTGIRTTRSVISTQHVVLSTGPDSAAAAAQLCEQSELSERFPMDRIPGLLVRTPTVPPNARVRHVIYRTDQGHFHLRPTEDEGLLLGADDVDETLAGDSNDATLARGVDDLLARAKEQIPDLPVSALRSGTSTAIGIRPMPSDRSPIAGRAPWAEGLYLVVTHSGVTLAPTLAKLMTELVVSGQTPPLLTPYRYERFNRD